MADTLEPKTASHKKLYIYGGSAVAIVLVLYLLYKRKQRIIAESQSSQQSTDNVVMPGGLSWAPISAGVGGGGDGGIAGGDFPLPAPPAATNAPSLDWTAIMAAMLGTKQVSPTPAPAPTPAPTAPALETWSNNGTGTYTSSDGATATKTTPGGEITITSTGGAVFTGSQVQQFAIDHIKNGDYAGLKDAQSKTGISDQSLNNLLQGTGYQV